MVISANNTALSIADMETSGNAKIKWLDKVINGKDDQYNKLRAITKKGEVLIKEDRDIVFNTTEINLLHTSYVYSFSQKMKSMFNSSHNVLWHLYSQTQNHIVLLKLFKQSSLFWRIYDNVEREQFYSLKILGMINNLLPESFDFSKHRYVTFRVHQISDK